MTNSFLTDLLRALTGTTSGAVTNLANTAGIDMNGVGLKSVISLLVLGQTDTLADTVNAKLNTNRYYH